MNCTPSTMAFYQFTAGSFVLWLASQGVTDLQEITARYVRQYLAQLIAKGRKDTTLHANARAIRTLLRFWHFENYMPALVKFDMPKLTKKRLPVLTADELKQVIKACNVRDRAIVFFMADSGLRRQEVINLNWGDVNIQTGLVHVKQGKGQKDRSAVIGATTRRALLAYRRSQRGTTGEVGYYDAAPLFQTSRGSRFTGNGLMMMFRRLSKRTGIHVTAHALRRTFTIMALRAGMNPVYVQNLAGWEDMQMLIHYAQMEDIDLLQEHHAHSPIDGLL